MTTLRSAHGTARESGALIVVETPPIDEIKPATAEDTARGLRLAAKRGRPFEPGNSAGKANGPELTRTKRLPKKKPSKRETATYNERRNLRRKAKTLQDTRRRELAIEWGAIAIANDKTETVSWKFSTAVLIELKHWARATAWSEWHDDRGEPREAMIAAERASAHGLKAIALASNEAKSHASVRPAQTPWFVADDDKDNDEADEDESNEEDEVGNDEGAER